MMKWIVFLGLFFGGFLFWKADRSYAWAEHAPAGGRFAAKFPASPSLIEKQIEYRSPYPAVPSEHIPFHWHQTKRRLGAEMFCVGYVDLPQREASAEHVLNQMKEFLAFILPNTSFAKPELEKIIDLGGVPGREIRLATKGYILHRNKTLIARAYFKDFRLYVVVTEMRDRNAPTDNVDTFLDSFRLTA